MTETADTRDPNVHLSEDEQEAQYRAEIAEGAEAARLLGDPTLQAYFQACEKDVIGEFVAAEDGDVARLVRAKQDYAALARLFDKLRTVAQTGKMARIGLNSLQAKTKARNDRRAQALADHDAVTDYDAVLKTREGLARDKR